MMKTKPLAKILRPAKTGKITWSIAKAAVKSIRKTTGVEKTTGTPVN
jgi:hypothetical protein